MRGTAYAIGEIIFWLLIATVIGFAIGWVLRRWFLVRTLQESHDAQNAAGKRRRLELEQELENWKSKATTLSSDLDLRNADLERSLAQIVAVEVATSAAEAKSKTTRMEALKFERQVIDRESTIASLRVDLNRSQGEVASLKEAAEEAGRTIASLGLDAEAAGDEIARLRAQLQDLTTKAAESRELTAHDVPDRSVAVARVVEIAQRTRGDGPADNDDLKKIHGVGPKLERLLKSMDITSFRQVANFTADDIQYVTAALDAFPGRIERDDWVASAAAEHSKKYGHPL